ncbi:MAG: thioredoxin family protein [Flavobacteriaceae bacterium]
MRHFSLIFFFFCAISVFSQDWQASYQEAVKASAENNEPIILVFSGSDWCAPCIKLDKNIWQSPKFKTYANEHYVLYRADFPRKKANQLSAERTMENVELADRYNPKGYFPLVVVLDKKGKVLGTTGYKKLTPTEYVSHLNSFIK